MIRNLILAALIALGIASGAQAATKSSASSGGVSATYIGPRVGFSVDPDQFVVGGHISAGFARDWTFNPSVELGFGDHEMVTALNFDAEYHLRLKSSNWVPYFGAGMGVNFVHVSVDPPGNDFNDTVTGLNIIIGTSVPTASGQRIFTEMRLGSGDADVPEFKGIVGWNFNM